MLRPKRALYLQRVNAHIAWLAEVLADGRKFISGQIIGCGFVDTIRFGSRGKMAAAGKWADRFPSVIDPWYKRVAAIGHGNFSEMTPDQAIEVAKVNGPSEPDQWSPEAQNVGIRRGDWVSVTPDDYGNAVYGNILAWSTNEIVVRHEDPSVGKVNLRFPRVGFDVTPAQRQAA